MVGETCVTVTPASAARTALPAAAYSRTIVPALAWVGSLTARSMKPPVSRTTTEALWSAVSAPTVYAPSFQKFAAMRPRDASRTACALVEFSRIVNVGAAAYAAIWAALRPGRSG